MLVQCIFDVVDGGIVFTLKTKKKKKRDPGLFESRPSREGWAGSHHWSALSFLKFRQEIAVSFPLPGSGAEFTSINHRRCFFSKVMLDAQL